VTNPDALIRSVSEAEPAQVALFAGERNPVVLHPLVHGRRLSLRCAVNLHPKRLHEAEDRGQVTRQ